MTGANLLVALFSERESHAVYFLQEQEMTRLDAVNYISHGIAKVPGRTEQRRVRGAGNGGDPENPEQQAKSGSKRSRPIASTSTRRPRTARSTR